MFLGEEEVQRQLDGSKRIFAAGEARTTLQCRIKMKALKREYPVIKDHNNKTANLHKTSRYNVGLLMYGGRISAN